TIGVSFSFFVSGPVASAFDWQTAYLLFGTGPVLGFTLVALTFPGTHKRTMKRTVFEFKPVLRSKPTLGYMCAYFLHNSESSTIRAFIVSFLVLAIAAQPPGEIGVDWDPIMIAAITNLFGLPSIMLANELARFWSRKTVITIIMVSSAAIGLLMAVSVSWSFFWVVVLVMLHGFLVPADVGSINAGLVGITDPARRGATMACMRSAGLPVLLSGRSSLVPYWTPRGARRSRPLGSRRSLVCSGWSS
ncbi:MAG: hypothetical protein ACJ0HN_04495, partial [Alphaproteobacteria bacterium]